MCHAGNHRVERLHWQPFFENESTGEEARNRTADGHIVCRAADRQLANIATGKEERVNHVAVGGERQPVALGRESREVNTRLVLLFGQPGVIKRVHKQLTDQLMHRLSTASVRHFHRVHASHS